MQAGSKVAPSPPALTTTTKGLVIMADSPHTTYNRKIIRGREIQALADRLEARGASRLSTGSPEQRYGLLRIATKSWSTLRRVADMAAPKLARLRVTFHRGGHEIDSEEA